MPAESLNTASAAELTKLSQEFAVAEARVIAEGVRPEVVAAAGDLYLANYAIQDVILELSQISEDSMSTEVTHQKKLEVANQLGWLDSFLPHGKDEDDDDAWLRLYSGQGSFMAGDFLEQEAMEHTQAKETENFRFYREKVILPIMKQNDLEFDYDKRTPDEIALWKGVVSFSQKFNNPE